MAVKKAIVLSNPGHTVIHLFHVRKTPTPWNLLIQTNILQVRHNENFSDKLLRWKKLIEEHYPELGVQTHIAYSQKIENAIIEKAKDIKADLIVIGKHSFHGRLTFMNTVFPNNIAKATGCPVLTCKPGSIYTTLKLIVVPVGTGVPQKKVDLIMALKEKFRITVHLVTVISKTQNRINSSGYSLVETYRYLKDIVQCPLDHKVLEGENIAQTALNYARSVQADMLLVEPEHETRLSSFPTKHIIDELKPNSRLQILAIRS